MVNESVTWSAGWSSSIYSSSDSACCSCGVNKDYYSGHSGHFGHFGHFVYYAGCKLLIVSMAKKTVLLGQI